MCLLAIISIKNVDAKEIVYTNDHGIELDKYEYKFFKDVYGSTYLQYLDEDTYNDFSDIDFEHPNVETESYIEPSFTPVNNQRGTYYSTPVKSINISKVCGALCRVITSVTWFYEPSVKSYDVIGAYLAGPTRTGTPATAVHSTLSTDFAVTTKYDTDGFGAVVEIPQGDDVVLTQNFTYSGTGTIYSSYQHAMSTSSLAIAQMFNISPVGFGGVFGFYGDAYDIYDEMNGVDIIV